ncbi:uncharacterized protein LOC132798491 [Drosophila nasuta]|uniref:Uncharacterized protein LOC117565363 n=1 Tax=Drosophila albomicans TaxID=7291 RepID=A0A6P8W9T7_DROAB|nr:uncharacterized protein LOC117565363 [Drosophila albomicans]XP_034100318.1 uncharacterized protein LOC117565363 [Drosophila albomicans]XP_060666344.1 uncharacterized protein LOC132798491 [Drosophila nasuta]XP_060666345.1 uncharacterized protein LOC132798491 [Drosophila nasuta]
MPGIMSTKLVYFVFIALTANFLSVSAIRCHQCNSHENADCANLLVKTPRAQRDDQYLRECTGQGGGDQQAFCRKTIIKLELYDEHRIDRSCGWIAEKTPNSCFSADNEGFKQTICTCSDDGCNGATSLSGFGGSLITSLGLAMVLRYLLRH